MFKESRNLVGPCLFAFALGATLLCGADAAKLNLQISNETAPPGGWVQIKIFASSPASISSASISMDLDPATFANITRVMVFSGSGDAIGYADISALHLDVYVSSPSGSIGFDPGTPILAVWADVFVGAAPGSVVPLTISPSSSLTDTKGNAYGLMVIPGSMNIRQSMSIQDVIPGGGIVEPGTDVRIIGSGFDAATNVTIDGLKLSSAKLTSAGEIDATVDASSPAVEMTGRHVHVTNGAGDQIDYFPSWPGGESTSYQWIIPLKTFSTGLVSSYPATHGGESQGLVLLNQNWASVTVELFATDVSGAVLSQGTVVIPPGSISFGAPLPSEFGEMSIASSAPIRMIGVMSWPAFWPATGTDIVFFTPGQLSQFPLVQLPVSTNTAAWSVAIGSPQPSPIQIQIGGDLPFSASVNQPWLTVTPAMGAAPATLTLTPKLAGLAAGTYSATVNINPSLPAALPGLHAAPSSLKVTLTLTAGPLISADGVSWLVIPPSGIITTNPVTTWVYTNGGNAPFKVEFVPPAAGFTVSPASGVAPAVLTFTANATGTTNFTDYETMVLIQGPNNNIAIPVRLSGDFPPILSPPLVASPSQLSFLLASTPGKSQTQTVAVPALPSPQLSVQSAGNWLSAAFVTGTSGTLSVTANSSNQRAGHYTGLVTIAYPNQAGYPNQTASVEIDVALDVYDPPTPQTVLSAVVSGSTISVTSSDVAVLFTVEGASANSNAFEGYLRTPATLQFGASPKLPNGIYQWNVVIHWANGDLVVPVSATVPAPVIPPAPSMSTLFNAASTAYPYAQTLVPGEIMSIKGQALALAAQGLYIGANGMVATEVYGTSVVMGGFPCPLLFVSPTQLNFVVPYEIATSQTAAVQVVTPGGSASFRALPVGSAAPGIFTANSGGYGQAAALNQDDTVNSLTNPAARGSVIQIFATGEGQTSPPGVTGSVTGDNPKKPLLPVSVSIGGIDAPVVFAGSAPLEVAGLLQVNALIPEGVSIGARVPIALKVGGVTSQTGVFVAIR